MSLSAGQLEQVWVSNGGNPASAPMAAAIAMAESGGNPSATNHNTNGTVDRGAWQINSIHGGQSTYDLNANAKAAIAISNNGANWGPWTTFHTGAYRQFLGHGGSVPHAGGASASPPSGGFGVPSVSTTFSGGGTDWNSAGIAALMKNASAPINTSGKFHADNLLGDFVSNAESGNFTNPSVAQSHLTAASPGFHLPGSGPVGSHSGDVNPLPGFKLGRTDMGVDASARPGQAIVAPNDSVVVGIQRNWYAGQPYVWMRITSGPNAGKYWYVAEQITNLPKVGQVIGKGERVATFAPSGTGIEIGWGSPSWETQAQAQGNTGDAAHGNAPAGVNFRNYLGSLGAR